jgi:hypothetical protein
MKIHLVYQSGIANVFKIEEGKRVRLLQHAYGPCEDFCRGAKEMGATIKVWHADMAGDAASAQWLKGAGSLWSESKRPPR